MPNRQPATTTFEHRAYAQSVDEVLEAFEVSRHGLTRAEVAARQKRFGYNVLPGAKSATLLQIFLHQFLSPLIYVLLAAAVVSLVLREYADAAFISAVLLINAVIGTYQEFTAQRSAEALRRLVTVRAHVHRDGDDYLVDSEELVPGDVVLLEPGAKVPADVRLVEAHQLECDESLLTGESLAVDKRVEAKLAPDGALGDRVNMAFAGTMVTHGRSRAVVVATGLATELGRIAAAVIAGESAKPPLVQRMDQFTLRVAIFIGVAVLIMAAVLLIRGTSLTEIFFLSVALAVSAIPEGLPVALTVALAVGTDRMARRNVIVRRLVAVESLGSCTCIATDKTGTLTVNQMTVRQLRFPKEAPTTVTGEGMAPEGIVLPPEDAEVEAHARLLERLCEAAVLANEATLAQRDGGWVYTGDAVDAALLVLARKAKVNQTELRTAYPELATIPFEPQERFAASVNEVEGRKVAFVKGAIENVLDMCTRMATRDGELPLERGDILDQVEAMAHEGYRVLAIASGRVDTPAGPDFTRDHLRGLTFLGLVGMLDPLRPEVSDAMQACQEAGIQPSMVTGDHPITALAIARELGMARDLEQVVTGTQLGDALQVGDAAVDQLTANARVFARVEPQQKLEVVRSLIRNGHYVAVTGDGANDAPALKVAHVGAAMGRSGTDVARETADLIITDDNFASVVAGVEEGRIAYANVRKVIFLLISTGAAEIVLFALALAFGLPLPLGAVQLLWLNLVTNGIQDVALAFEPGEGGEMRRPPRPPREGIFNRLMVERVVVSALVIGVIAFAVFGWLLGQGVSEHDARNVCLLLMVLFENVQAFNSRSETRSVFRHSPLRNRLLLFGTLIAQAIHIAAMYVPGLNDVLGIQPVSFSTWAQLLGISLILLAVMELQKWWERRRESP
ncbi:MAG: HAD-IC family P-type ATPase [Betaproteobacteria bacterium]|nr:HAD-IC family P-type ATPase [Betaproteobacteria bacterium]